MDLLQRAPEPSPLSKYELERMQRIQANRKRMEELGVLETARNLVATINASKPPRPPVNRGVRKPRARGRLQPLRRSGRLTGKAPVYGEIDGDLAESGAVVRYRPSGDASDSEEGGLDDLLAGDDDVSKWEPAKQEQFQELRCTSAGRGSMYDSRVGITCHFCRQKKLCGEEGCPRCSRRSVTAECIGKTECSKCQGPTGRFCRACLQLRYGQTLESARAEMAKGEWLCPHCHEDEHPHDGWMCNSSICMKRRGFKPTGIAIYDAQQRGFVSVAHWLQAQIKKRGVAAVLDPAAGGSAEEEGASAAGAAPAAGAARQGRRRRGAAAGTAAEAAALEAVPEEASEGGGDDDVGRSDQDSGKRRTRGAAAAAAVTVAVAAAGKAKPGKDAAPKAGSRGKAGKAGSREGSNEPFAPATPAKPAVVAAAGEGGRVTRAARRL
ncbi:hypothetical protein Rsub_12443 [Raphidocelis subcapitata]|uniref:Zinc-finger domain-containing protein n=1 Tax=Raphidocelis subcapitata TaxID=307507 RepID=A0A2V0PP08_9CHLO|nr:hypothetical protein Rsub_12443 [Raphidocelis subcapitata]|eukprot:GBF99730.1 hypothetical protein Rsub_12443 [Raphidocelis subcapitata]